MQRRMMMLAVGVALGLAATLMAESVRAQQPDCSAYMCLPGYTAQLEPVPGSIFGTMTCRCRANWTGSSPNIESSDPTRRSTVILSQAGPLVVNGCGAGHETAFNIRGHGGFFAAGERATALVRVSTGLADNEVNFERTDGGTINSSPGTFVSVANGDNVVRFRYQAGTDLMDPQMNPGGRHTISLRLVDDSLNTPIAWSENGRGYTQKYRIAPTGGVQFTFNLDGPGC